MSWVLLQTRSRSFFRVQKVVVLDTVGLGVKGGSFALSFGPPTFKLPGSVILISGSNYITTYKYWTPFLIGRDVVILNNESYTIPSSYDFTPTQMTLSRIYIGESIEYTTMLWHMLEKFM